MHLIVLGTGCAQLMDHFSIKKSIILNQVLDFPIYNLEGHDHIIYEASHKAYSFIAISGRLHSYEDYSLDQLYAPIKYALNNYEITSVILTSASGGLQSNIKVGYWHSITAFLSIPQIPGLSIPAIPSNQDNAFSNLPTTTYAYHQGPSLGTMAEYKMLSQFDTGLVGMSLLPEAIYLKKQGMPFQCISVPVCNYAPFQNPSEPSHQEVIKIASHSIKQLSALFKSYLTS